MSYSYFADHYDALTSNVDYNKLAEAYDGIIKKHGKKGNILLDLGCGTGSFSFEMAKRGYDVIGVDVSDDMLGMAFEKKMENGLNVQFLCQSMTELDMFGTVDITVSTLDSINHLDSTEEIGKAFEKVAFFAEYEGLFIFDMNTPYKHEKILSSNTFVYDLEDVFCVWQNEYTADEENRVMISLDLFEKETEDKNSNKYTRYSEDFSEIAPKHETIVKLLEEKGFELIEVLDYDTLGEMKDDSQKLIYVARCLVPKRSC